MVRRCKKNSLKNCTAFGRFKIVNVGGERGPKYKYDPLSWVGERSERSAGRGNCIHVSGKPIFGFDWQISTAHFGETGCFFRAANCKVTSKSDSGRLRMGVASRTLHPSGNQRKTKVGRANQKTSFILGDCMCV